jgi:hypothetical protein
MYDMFVILLTLVIIGWTVIPAARSINDKVAPGFHAFLTGVFLFIGLLISVWVRDEPHSLWQWVVDSWLVVGITIFLVGNQRDWHIAVDHVVPGGWMFGTLLHIGCCLVVSLHLAEGPYPLMVAYGLVFGVFATSALWLGRHERARQDS